MHVALNNLALDVKIKGIPSLFTKPAKATPEGVTLAPFMSHRSLSHIKICSLF